MLKDDYIPNLEAKTKITIENLFESVNAGCVSKNRALLLELYEMLAVKGIKTFPISYYEVTETELVSEYSFSEELSKISKPNWSKIPKLPNNGNWLLASEEITWKESFGKWQRVRTFKSHKEGKRWDELIFKI